MSGPRFLLHFAPKTRAFRILWLLEELGASCALIQHDLDAGTQKTPEFLAINPDGKLPVLEDRGPDGDWSGVVVTESLAICAYLDELHPGRLSPPPGSRDRALYQTMMAYGAGVLEPALADKAFPRAAPPPPRALGWPDFATAVARIERQIGTSGGPFLLGQALSTADVLIGSTLQWVTAWGLLTPSSVTASYLAALEARPALASARAREAARA
ncbi:glutathione S-transferase [Roseomonas frigidaquae]|uniref:Glutathione S-transferase n=1 Tax=Falsiroseomonas frigidaquae TaxID=487318 RepID=A0ABX1F3H4_9PROT|nr:glutathione S-transferase [Falsiroseomonas frigidaquae]NKE46829.1 glutathione S-transferase [Falsiroseomonas frigidaquae]